MQKVKFDYIDKTTYKTFNTKKAFLQWANDESHNGTYYISYNNMTVTKTRQQVLDNYK